MDDIESNTNPETMDKKRVVLDRAISMNIERVPLTSLPKYKTASPRLLGKWKSYKKRVTDDTGEDIDNGYHCMKRGESPPADDMVMFDSFEDLAESEAFNVKVYRESVRQSLKDLIRSVGKCSIILEDIEAGKISVEDFHQHFIESTKLERNVAFLWAALMKRLDLLKILYELSVDVNYTEPIEGFTALHLSAFSGCVKCSEFLISKGAKINFAPKWFTPLHSAAFGNSFEVVKLLLRKGAKFEMNGSTKTREDLIYGNPLHSAVKANAIECVQLLVNEVPDINSLEPRGVSPLHSAAELGHIQPLRILLEHGVNPNLATRDRKNTALHLAAEGGFSECVSLLLSKGASANARNCKGQIPLHLAARAQSVECVDLLLNEGGSDPNAIDNDKRSPLHSAVGKSLLAFEITELLLVWNAEVNQKDKYGFTPLHIAALNEQAQCVETLLYHGGDVSAKTNGGSSALSFIVRKTPASLGMLYQKLDCAISLHDPEATNREVELKLDFRYLLQNCKAGEIGFLKTFVDAGQKEVLEHPLCEAFLYLKWEKIRKYYIGRIIFCSLFVLCLTAYVLMALAHNCYNVAKIMKNETAMPKSDIQEETKLCADTSITAQYLRKYPIVTEIMWFVLVFFTVCEILRKLIGCAAYTSFKHYVCQVENLIEWLVISSVFVVSCIYTGRTYTWQNHVGAFAVLLCWLNLMVMIGQLPALGSYVTMFTSVQKEFAKLFTAYLCLLIGFTISFCVIFPQHEAFSNPFIGFIKVLVMMTGELEFEDLLLGKDDNSKSPFLLEISAHVIFVVFLLFVTVILMNLLVGIAVHDIQGLQKTAGLMKLVCQTELISYIESALFTGYLPNCVVRVLQWTALVSPSAYRVVIQVKPLNPQEKRLPKNVLQAAYEVAKDRKRCGHTVSTRGSSSSASFCYVKSRGASFNDQKNSFGQTVESENMQSLIKGLEEGSKAISNIKEEINELKEVTRKNQAMLNQILEALGKKTTDC